MITRTAWSDGNEELVRRRRGRRSGLRTTRDCPYDGRRIASDNFGVDLKYR